MELTKLYEFKTGEKAIYRKGSSDYHTLKYVKWLESRVFQQTVERELIHENKNTPGTGNRG